MMQTNTNGNNCGGSMFVWLMVGLLFTVALVSVILILRDNHSYLTDQMGENELNAALAENPAADQAADTFKAGADKLHGLVENHIDGWVPYVTAGTATTAGFWFSGKLQNGPRTAMMTVAFGLLALAAIFYGVMKTLMFTGDVTGIKEMLVSNAVVLKIVPWILVSTALGIPALYGACHLVGMACGGEPKTDEAMPHVVYMPASGYAAAAAPGKRRLFVANAPVISCCTLILLLSIFATLVFLSWRYSSHIDATSYVPRNEYVVKKPASFPLGQRAAASPRVGIEG